MELKSTIFQEFVYERRMQNPFIAMAQMLSSNGVEQDQLAASAKETSTSLIRVFPNPSAGNINIEIQGLAMEAAEYIVHDNLGNEIFRGMVNSSISLNFISSGTYSIQVVTENEVLIEKIIVLK